MKPYSAHKKTLQERDQEAAISEATVVELVRSKDARRSFVALGLPIDATDRRKLKYAQEWLGIVQTFRRNLRTVNPHGGLEAYVPTEVAAEDAAA